VAVQFCSYYLLGSCGGGSRESYDRRIAEPAHSIQQPLALEFFYMVPISASQVTSELDLGRRAVAQWGRSALIRAWQITSNQ
jgi:hypothetical protein